MSFNSMIRRLPKRLRKVRREMRRTKRCDSYG
jgi:hypothetical protein